MASLSTCDSRPVEDRQMALIRRQVRIIVRTCAMLGYGVMAEDQVIDKCTGFDRA